LDEKTGKSYLFFLIENENKKRSGGKIGLGFFLKKRNSIELFLGSRTQYDWGFLKYFFLIFFLDEFIFIILKDNQKIFLQEISIIRLVLRTEVLTQEKRMFLLHSLKMSKELKDLFMASYENSRFSSNLENRGDEEKTTR